MRERLRAQDGNSVIEVAIASGLLLVVLAPMMLTLTSAQRREAATEEAVRAISDGRIAIERIVRDVREADGVEVPSSHQLEVWIDDDGDGVEDAAEVATYEIDAAARTLERSVVVSQVIAEGIDAASSFGISDENAGELVEVSLSIDPDTTEPPGSTILRTEVLTRNA